MDRPATPGSRAGEPAGPVLSFGCRPCRGFPMSLLAELWRFMRVRKKFWLLPIIVVMFLLGGLLILAKGSAVAPFIYTLF